MKNLNLFITPWGRKLTDYYIIEGYHTYYTWNTVHLEKVQFINDFGVFFDSTLSFREHISQKIKKHIAWLVLSNVISSIWVQKSILPYKTTSYWICKLFDGIHTKRDFEYIEKDLFDVFKISFRMDAINKRFREEPQNLWKD